jgi:hypothetical protein
MCAGGKLPNVCLSSWRPLQTLGDISGSGKAHVFNMFAISYCMLPVCSHLQISTMEEEVAAKQQLLQQLQAENAALQSKMRVLETSLNCSTQIHGLMQLIDSVDRLGISSSSPEVSGASGSLSSRSSSEAAAAAAVAGLVAPSVTGLEAGLLRSSGSCGSGSSSGDAAMGGLDASGSSSSLHEPHRQQQWFQQEQLPVQAWASQPAEACQLHQQATAAPSGSSSLPVGMLPGSSAASGDASSNLQAVSANAQQQQQQAAGSFASGVAAAAAASQGAAAAGSPSVAAAVSSGPLSGQVSSPEQGVVLYKEFLGKAQALMALRSGSDPGEQWALCMCVCLCCTMSGWQLHAVSRTQRMLCCVFACPACMLNAV